MHDPQTAQPSQARPIKKWIVGGLILTMGIGLTVFLLTPAVCRDPAPPWSACQLNMHQLCGICWRYMEEHERRLPQRLDDLKPYVSPHEYATMTFCPNIAGRHVVRYELLQAGKKITSFNTPSTTIILQELEPNHRHGKARVVCYADGQTGLITEQQAP